MSLTPADRKRRGRVRGVVAVVFFVAWGFAITGLVQRDVQRSVGQRMAELALRVNPGNVFYAVEQNGQQIGWGSSTIDTLPDSSSTFLVVRDELVADLTVGGVTQRASGRTEIRLTRAFALLSFGVNDDASGTPLRVNGRAESDSVIAFVDATGGAPSDTQRVRAAGPILLPNLLPLATILGDQPRVGRQVTYSAFDPATRTARDVMMEITAESLFVVDDSASMNGSTGRWVAALRDTVRAWRLTTDDLQGLTGWVDAQGRWVEVTTAAGFTLRRMAFEMAFENWRLEAAARATVLGSAGGAVVERSVIAANVPLPRRELVFLRTRITAPATNQFQLDGGRQRFSGSELSIQAEGADQLRAAYTLPVNATHRTAFRRELEDELLLQLRATPIVRLSAQLWKFEPDPRVVVERITRWVYDSLQKVPASSRPDALVVLTSRRGDCNEHTQLFTAIARHLGIPTRIAAGVVLVGGTFYYHAWPEVYLGDWVAADPTFGQFPAAATHIRLISGGFERQSELHRLLGTLTIEVLEAR